jgi:predicted TIM-barrel fold metal-dependent hydrolase
MRMSVVDGNVHLVASANGRGAAGWPTDWQAGASLPVQVYLKEMDAAGVTHAVAVTPIRTDGFDNGYTAAAAAGHADRLVAVGNLDVLAPGAPEAMTEWVGRGLRGMRFFGADHTDARAWLADPRAAAAWRRAGELGIPVSAQRTRMSTVPALAAVVARHPDVTVVVYSLGDPPYEPDAPLFALARFPQVHLCLSVDNLRRPGADAFFERVAERFGPHRLLWGSYSRFRGARGDAADPTLAEVVALVRRRFGFLTESERARVLGGTASALYGEQGSWES